MEITAPVQNTFSTTRRLFTGLKIMLSRVFHPLYMNTTPQIIHVYIYIFIEVDLLIYCCTEKVCCISRLYYKESM